ncbi:BMC domain-containing protein [Lignipirellula cremea]|uniref:Major carboxysome shell protein 1A n=1 Tax=Lignipirellula cremea TaxID=2528010 RepID=A0A518DNK8_9BACT|nr:BMC domain-containing protein [Lignipirellula cremea]QDU93393.1 Major carboxysome shell protein 1A [Lignipirellula cremea]
MSALGILETTGYTPAMVALDVMGKAASVSVLEAELNDFLGFVIKITGELDQVRAALEAGTAMAEQMGGKPLTSVLPRPDAEALQAIRSRPEISPLMNQQTVYHPQTQNESETAVAEPPFALGFLETQGFTAVFEAIDSACKAANVEVVGKEKLGGGYVTIVIKGDVAAVTAAVETGKSKVEGLGKLIAAHVIARPSASVLSLLPK